MLAPCASSPWHSEQLRRKRSRPAATTSGVAGTESEGRPGPEASLPRIDPAASLVAAPRAGGGTEQAHAKDGAAMGIHPVGGREHGLLAFTADAANRFAQR